MENKNVGWLVIGIGIIMIIVILMFNSVLKENLGLTCSHGPSCEMYTNLNVQTWISLSIVGVIFIIGLVLIFTKPKEKIVVKKIKERIEVPITKKPIDYSKLDKEEKVLVKIIEESNGTIFQSDLVDKSQFGKVKVSRVLDRLEGKQMIERKRRGMTNVVVLK